MKITLNHASSIPLHVQIEEQLRVAIKSEEYQKGVKLPNEVALSKQLGISRATLRQSINKLVYEGLLMRKKGVGTFVKKSSISSKAQNWLSFSQEMKALGIETKNYELHLSWVKPTEELCLFFDIKEDIRILKLERLRGKAEYPFVYFISYFNPRIGLTGNEDFSRPLYEILEQDFNSIVKLSKEEISAISADSYLAGKLEIKAGDPILKRKRFVFDPGSRPLEWNVGYYKADSFTYTLEFEREI
ncbi:GntR family transcriptional regulator [Flavobacterium piscis]|jgi:GntR family transcriptional regulator|uniref:GntR family transcriptional regulator n=1 Tax=Flavobacterium piscis TaxID=1114874 RepID=A0ABX2XDI2_9FLAO|nr:MULTISPECIES: GntR family transcriptional regulator [Flavobacterium]OCB69972.1 GntR family transcriptional regulator [Flavobacterium piscis]OXE99232.1 GntR family transcriptional regulator [Flavobacterium piscis]QDW23060.1 GntR family transcriptional regulator [Flavobacterium sp. KBS0721]